MSEKKRAIGRLNRRILIAASVVLGVILTVLLGGTIYAEYLLGQVNYVDPDATVPTLSQEQIEKIENELGVLETIHSETEAAEEETMPEHVEKNDQVVTFLLVGADKQSGDITRSDSMILCTFNKYTNAITLTSLMRDMYVRIPGYKSNRINVSYAFGGMQLLNKTITHNFGVETDGTVEIDFSNFQKLIDMLGGIELELSEKEANYINYKAKCELEPGIQTLNGKQALWYSRYRKDGGDFKRTDRQRIVLTVLLERYKNLSLTELMGMMDDILPMVTTDMTKEEILGHMINLFPMLSGAEIVTNRIPADKTYDMTKVDEMSVLLPNISKNARILKEIMTAPAETEPVGVG